MAPLNTSEVVVPVILSQQTTKPVIVSFFSSQHTTITKYTHTPNIETVSALMAQFCLNLQTSMAYDDYFFMPKYTTENLFIPNKPQREEATWKQQKQLHSRRLWDLYKHL